MACRKGGQARDAGEERGDQGEDGGGAAGPVDVKGTLAAPFLRPLVEIWEALPVWTDGIWMRSRLPDTINDLPGYFCGTRVIGSSRSVSIWQAEEREETAQGLPAHVLLQCLSTSGGNEG